jgi:hypothetical protein
MRYRNWNALEQTKGDKSAFMISKTIIFERICQARKDGLRVQKVEPMISQVREAFRFVPNYAHMQIVYTELDLCKAPLAAR